MKKDSIINLILLSSDTVYNYISKENRIVPFLAKTPTKDPEIFLTMGTLTDRYYFMEAIKKELDFKTLRASPPIDLMYDRQEKAVFKPAVINGDFVTRKTVDMTSMTSHPVNGEIATFRNLEAYQLVEPYKNDELSGRLKEIAAELSEESNPVIMVMKYKK